MLSFHSKKLTKKTVELASAAPTTRPKQLSGRSSLCGAINKLLGLNKSTSSSSVAVDAGVGRVKEKGKGKRAFRRSKSLKADEDRRMSCDWDCSAAAVAADPLVNYRVRIEDEEALPIADSSSDLKCPELSPASSFSTLSGADSDLSSLKTLPSLLVSDAHSLETDSDKRKKKHEATRADLIMMHTRAQRLPINPIHINFSRPLPSSISSFSSSISVEDLIAHSSNVGRPWDGAEGRLIREGKVGAERSYPVSLSFVPAHIAFVEGCSVEVELM